MSELISAEFGTMLVRLVICVLVNWFIIHCLYFKKSKRLDFYFTFLLISISIFFLVYFMIFVLEDMKGKTSMGIGIGLFGIFSIMRYRTDTMPVREMTYLFSIICLSVVNALAVSMTYPELLITNVIVIIAIAICEAYLKPKAVKVIQYDRIELVNANRHDELLADLEARTGLKILNVEVGGIDFLKDTAVLRITYEGPANNEADGQFRVTKSQWRSAF